MAQGAASLQHQNGGSIPAPARGVEGAGVAGAAQGRSFLRLGSDPAWNSIRPKAAKKKKKKKKASSDCLCALRSAWWLLGPLDSYRRQFSPPNITLSLGFFFFFFFFSGPHPWHMEIPRLGNKSELQLPADATATAMPDPICVCDRHHSSRQHRMLNPLSKARD